MVSNPDHNNSTMRGPSVNAPFRSLVVEHQNSVAQFALMPLFQVFILLQFLDALTTVVVLQYGGYEANPIVKSLMTVGPIYGLVLAKLIVVAIGTAVLRHGRQRVLFMGNFAYAGIICWNLFALSFAG